MFEQTGVLVGLIVLTIVLAGIFLLRSSITDGAKGKILAFLGLCVLPVLCIVTGLSVHMARSKETSYCISCHSMASHGRSLYVDDKSYLAAQHFQNHLVPPDKACYTCHTNYTMYGPLEDKLKGLKYIYMEYVSSPPKVIHISGVYSNLQCLHCHAGARGFSDNPVMAPIMGSLTTDKISCLTCHSPVHNVAQIDHLKMWVDGDAPVPPASAPSPSASAGAQPAAGSADDAAAPQGKSVFDSHGCAGCHGQSGAGGSGPALTHISVKYPAAQLTAILKKPNAGMTAAGMTPLTADAADMKALVSYLESLGGASGGAVSKPPVPVPSAPATAKATATAPSGPKTASAATPAASPSPAKTAPAGGSTGAAATTQGKSVFDSHGCAGCHGQSGAGGSGPALTHISSKYPAAQLTAILKKPTAAMTAAGMTPLTANAADMKALVSYVTSLGGAAASPAAKPPASGSPSPAPAAAPSKAAPATTPPASPSASPAPPKAAPVATAGAKAATGGSSGDADAAQGKSVYDSQGCSGCHGASGSGGSGPALTHISSQYPPAQLTTLLKAPTSAMTGAGMVPLTINAADMKALVSYVTSLGGTSASSGVNPAASGAPAKAQPATAAAPSKADSRGQAIFNAHGCADCHGIGGVTGTAAGPALAGTGKTLTPASLSTMLQHPTAKMQQGGMPPVSLSSDDLKALVAYVSSISASKGAPH